ncbi:MAG: TRAP transporter substrate-binding protein [Azospirillaceae bacterium]
MTSKSAKRAAMLAGGTALAALMAGGAATAQEFTMRLAHHYPTTHVQGQGYEYFVERVAELSDGRIETITYPAGSLINGLESFEGVRSGTVEASNMIGSFQVGDLPELDAFMLPFQFDDAAHFRRALDAGLFEIIQAQYEEQGIRILNYFHKGNIHVFHTDHHLMTPADFEGEDIRGLGGYLTRTLEALGASAVTLGTGEVSAALERGVIDGVMTNCQGHFSRGWGESAAYVSYLDLAQSGEGLGVNLEWWNSLPPDLQEVVQQAADEMEDMEWDLVITADEVDCFELWDEAGFEVQQATPEQRTALREAVQPLYEEAAASFETLPAIMDLVEETRE